MSRVKQSHLTTQSERILKIQEKLNSINIGVENERFQKLELAEARLRAIEEHFSDVQESFFQRLNQLKDNVVRIQKVIEEDKINREQIIDQKTRDILALESKFVNTIDAESIARRESEIKIAKALEEKIGNLRSDIAHEGKLRNDAIEQMHQSLDNDLPKISDAIKQEAIEREENDQNIMKRITDDLQRVNSYLQQEKKNREESDEAIFDMLKDIVNRVKTELETEKKSREDTEEHLLALLEDTCSKLSTAASF